MLVYRKAFIRIKGALNVMLNNTHVTLLTGGMMPLNMKLDHANSTFFFWEPQKVSKVKNQDETASTPHIISHLAFS